MKNTKILSNENIKNINTNINLKNAPAASSTSKEVDLYKNELNIQHSVIIGLLLGDGSLYKSTPTSNARLELSFGEKYKEFAITIENVFKEYVSNPLKLVEIKGKNKKFMNYRLKTKSLSFFTHYFDLFYVYNNEKSKYIKVVPNSIVELMDPIALSYLIMSDGNYDKSRNRIRIYTNNFQKKEVELLVHAINTKFNIYVGVLHDRKDQ
jgi:hypothetical protein